MGALGPCSYKLGHNNLARLGGGRSPGPTAAIRTPQNPLVVWMLVRLDLVRLEGVAWAQGVVAAAAATRARPMEGVVTVVAAAAAAGARPTPNYSCRHLRIAA